MRFFVTDGDSFFSDEASESVQSIALITPGVPVYTVTNTCKHGRYRVEREILADPSRDVLLQRVRFVPMGRAGAELRLTVIALGGEIDLAACGPDRQFVLALSFARSPAAAAVNTLLALQEGFDRARDEYIREWQQWQQQLLPLDDTDEAVRSGATAAAGWSLPDCSRPAVPPGSNDPPPSLYRTGAMVLRVHRALHVAGAGVASLTIPWGEARGDQDRGGYHVVWARDLVEEAAGLLAAGAHADAGRVLHYLRATQLPDGHWPQDMWLDGTPYMSGVQMDEMALPILLVDLARRESAVTDVDCHEFWPMVRGAAEFLVRRGPVSDQDRWENSPGYSPYTVAAEIAALVSAAEFADRERDAGRARRGRQTADEWHDRIDRLMYVTGTDLAREQGIEGYYVRLAPREGPAARHRSMREESAHDVRVVEVVSPDALALVRFGVRRPDDPRMVNTLKAVDAETRVETPFGPSWHRCNGDYYGERADGTPPSGHAEKEGHGRAWPLLTGERGHYELAAGRPDEARRLLAAMNGFASAVGLLPEQVWDAADITDQGLHLGRPSRSAMPLAWAHAEYIRLLRSIRDGRVFDLPPQTQVYRQRDSAPRQR